MSEYKKHLLQTTHTNLQAHRTQISYGFILWMEGYDRMMFDTETRHAYTILTFAADLPRSWEEAHEACVSLGSEWALPTITDIGEDQMITSWSYDPGWVPVSGGMPINMMRNGSNAFQWVNGEAMTYNNWNSGEPSWTAASLIRADCGELTSSSYPAGKWANANCLQKKYFRIICEASTYYYAASTSFIVKLTGYPSVITKQMFTASDLPTPTPGSYFYGVTVQIPALQCKQSDKVNLGANNDNMVLLMDKDCIMMIGGVLLMSEWNDVLLGMELRSQSSVRPTVQFSYVFWHLPSVRNIVRHAATGHVYTTLYGTMGIQGYAQNPVAAHGMCQLIGMYAAEIQSEEEWLEQLKTHTGGIMFIGGIRSAGTFVWRSGAAMNWTAWWSQEPHSSAGKDCLVVRQWQRWQAVTCTTIVQAIGCEMSAWGGAAGVGNSRTEHINITPPHPTSGELRKWKSQLVHGVGLRCWERDHESLRCHGALLSTLLYIRGYHQFLKQSLGILDTLLHWCTSMRVSNHLAIWREDSGRLLCCDADALLYSQRHKCNEANVQLRVRCMAGSAYGRCPPGS